MKLTQTAIPDVVLIEPAVYEDDRGWFMESFNEQSFHAELKKLGLPIPRPFVQDNHSCSKKGVLRGLHYQRPPHAQGKLVRVTSGAAFDVAVDIRKGSDTFGQWVGATLTAGAGEQLWVPEGFAHGFCTLEPDTEVFYKVTNPYSQPHDAGIAFDDPEIGIVWPIDLSKAILSDKDKVQPKLASLR